MAEFKTRQTVSPLKTKTFQVKSGQSLRQLKSAPAMVRFRGKDAGTRFNTRQDQLAYKLKIIGRQGGKIAKGVPLAAGKAISAKVGNQISEKSGTAADDTENAMRLAGMQAKKHAYQVAHLPPGLARKKIERRILGDKIDAPVQTRTAFSPYKVRRQMYDKAYKKKRFDGRLTRMRNQYSAAQKTAQAVKEQAQAAVRTRKGASGAVRYIGRATQRATSAALHLLRAAKEGVKIGITAAASILPWLAAIGLPLLIIIAVVFAAGPANDAAQNGNSMLQLITAEGTATDSRVAITISDENGEVILSFTAVNNEGHFIFTKPAEGETEATNLNGRIKGSRITIKGTLQGLPVSMEGTIKKGVVKIEGFWGELAEEAMNGDWQNPFGRIKYVITSEFGIRVHPITGEVRQHDGYDLCANTGAGSNIYASASGTVSVAGWYGGYGKCVVIDHGGGLQSLYGHLSDISVKTGAKVRVGQKIGAEGSTGNSTGPHLHFEVRKDGTAVDGKAFLKTLYTNATSVDIWS